MNFRFLLIVVLLSFVAVGCSTTKQPSALSTLQIKVAQLERKIDEKDETIKELQYEVSELKDQVVPADNYQASTQVEEVEPVVAPKASSQSKDSSILRVDVSSTQVQKALKNAGFYDGPIDGKLGSGSQRAIKEFQKDNNLNADGVIGRRTWALLKEYLQ